MHRACVMVLLLAGCAPEYPEGRIVCESDADCPSGFTCRARPDERGRRLCYRGDESASTGRERDASVPAVEDAAPEGSPSTSAQGGTSAAGLAGAGGTSGPSPRAGEGASAAPRPPTPSSGGSSGADVAGAGAPDPVETCEPACSDSQVCVDRTCVDCKPGSGFCEPGQVPVVCDGAGTWVRRSACGGGEPSCHAGACVAVQLIDRGAVVLQPSAARAGAGVTMVGGGELRLVEHGIAGTEVCSGALCLQPMLRN
jgi:hypothetical protein